MEKLSAPRRGGVSAARRSSGLLLLASFFALGARASVINWTNLNGGSWSAPTNWSPNTVPALADDVFITTAGNYTVTQDLHVTVASLTLGGASGTQTLTNAGLTLTLNGPSVANANGVLGFGGGTLAGAGALTVGGTVVWTGGTISGALTVAPNGVLNINGTATKYLNGTGTLINQGWVAWSGPNDIETGNSARIINQPGALFDIQNNQSLSIGNGGAITNLGTLRKSAGGGATIITVPLKNFGTLDVQSGMVAYAAGSQFNDGTAFTGTGTNLVYTGIIPFNGVISSANLEIGGATIAGNSIFSGVVNWTSGALGSGALTVATNGVLNIKGSALKYLSGTGTLINFGLVAWSGTNDIETGNSARIINQPGALFDIQNNQLLYIYNGGAITNLGTLRKSAGGGTTVITVPLNNSGTLDVQSGRVAYGGGSQFNAGTAFTGAGTNLVYTGTVSFDGAISSENLEIGGATFGGTGVFSGLVNWTSGTLSRGPLTVATNGALHISGSVGKHLDSTGTLINLGVIAWSGTNDIETANYARIINQPGALFEIQNNQSLSIWNGGAITNLGTIRKSAGGGTTLITVPIYNSGTLDVQSGLVAYGSGSQFNAGTAFKGKGTNLVYAGTVSFNGAISSQNLEIGGANIGGNSIFSGVVNWTSGTIPDKSTFTVATNGVLHISGSGMKSLTGTGILINCGSVAWSGSNDIQTLNYARIINQAGAIFDIQNNQLLDIWNGGAITNLGTLRKSAGGGNTLVTVPLYNSGTVDVQNGTISFGNYTQTGGKLSFGLNSLTNFGRLALANSVAFTGTLGVNLNGGYVPVVGDSFALITYPSRAGAFAGFDLPATHAWQTNNSIYGATVLTLSVLNTRPTLIPITDQTTDEQVELAFSITASHPDPGQTITYSLLDPPAGVTINTNTGHFSWTPGEAQGPSTNAVTVQVTDNGTPSLSATQLFTVVVNEVNRAPTLTVPPTQTLDELRTLTVTNYATDPDIPANTLSFSLISAPPGVNLDTNTGVLTWTPTEAQGPSTNIITVAVLDNGTPSLGMTNDFTAIVREVNTAPSLIVPPAQTLDELTTLCVTNLATDADLPLNTLRFTLISAPPGVNLNTNTGVLTWTPAEVQGPSTNTITVAVTDNGTPSLGMANSFTVTVLESNVPPVLAAIPDLTGIQDVLLLYTNSATDADLPANSLTFDLVVAPSGMRVDALTGVLNWTPAAGQVPSTNLVTVRVTDNGQPARTDVKNLSVVTYPLPFLTITHGSTNVVLSWPAYAKGFALQQAAGLKPPVFWADMTNTVTADGGMNRVTNRADAPWRFFRLHFGAETSQPWLTMTCSNASVLVSWPLLATDWSLYATTNLVTGGSLWTQISPPYQTNGSNLQFTEPSPAGNKFYRLEQ